ncbi:hypothetical protein EJ04DRAFT_570053 [Polyplosphaeria fusca]|uniref:Translation initiation factor 5A-like N-terminal domain-containing protein n=1 Tax=Polyplosphaeria fusca TaxID=682080 RepID=A0A9P4QMY5_9PLEO|nr:hypothetical protein EJ04DRAFT_570053 [Polyplosphaeria fusca]
MHKKMISGSSTSIPDDEMDSQLQFALKQSNRAIKEILQHSARETLTDKINMLTHCILFRSLACIQGHTGLALEHLRSGLRILREVDEDLEANPDTPIDHPVSLYTLRALLVNMDIQAREIMTPAIRASWEPQPRRDFRTTNTPFQNISQARSYFEAIFNDAIAFMQVNDMTPPFPEEEAARLDHEICRLQSIFQTGSDNLGEFLSTVGISVEREALMGIQMIYHHIRIFMKAFERAKGVPQSQFILEEHLQMLVNLAGEALGAPPDFTLPLDAVPEDYAPPQAGGRKGGGSSTPGYSRPVYFCVSGTCSALWAVCAHTRDRALRRKALGLLLHYPRREGTWDSVLTGRVAWDLMRLEENCAICGGSGSPVNSDHSAVRSLTDIDASDMIKYDRTTPDCHTVVLVNIEVTGRRAAMLTYRTVLDDKLGQPGVVKEIVCVFPSSYRSDAATKETTKTKVEGEAKLPSKASVVGREGHEEERIESFSATLPADRRDSRYKEEVRIYEEDRVRRPVHREEVHIHEDRRYQQPERERVSEKVEFSTHNRYQEPYQRYVGSQIEVQDRTYDREFNTVHGPATDYAPTQIDVSERQYRERTRPIEGGYAAEQGYSNLSTQPTYGQAAGYRKDVDSVDSRYPSDVRVEKTTRTTVDAPKKHKRDMGYYDEDGHYHSFRHGLHKAADRILHPIHGHRHHHSESHSHTGSHHDDREEVVVKKYTSTSPPSLPRVTATAAPAARPAPTRVAPAPVSYSKTRYTESRSMAPHNTITIPCHHIRIGDLLILQGRPCQVIRITTSSQTGQHRYLGVDLFTKQLHEESSFISNPAPSVVVQNMLGPVFKQYRVLDIREDGRVVAMTETGDVKQGLPVLDQSALLGRLTESFDNGRGSVRILVINDDGQELAVDYKVVHGSRL